MADVVAALGAGSEHATLGLPVLVLGLVLIVSAADRTLHGKSPQFALDASPTVGRATRRGPGQDRRGPSCGPAGTAGSCASRSEHR
jgi:hypothetical protein